jgi:formylglycine-generating enzyme required for sulfatase activity
MTESEKPSPIGHLRYLLRNMTDYSAFERLCHALLVQEPEFSALIPRGAQHDQGVDGLLKSPRGIFYFQYSTQTRWEKKLKVELRKAMCLKPMPERYVFVTNRQPSNCKKQETEARVEADYGIEFTLLDFEWLFARLMRPQNGALREEFFGSSWGTQTSWNELQRSLLQTFRDAEVDALYLEIEATSRSLPDQFDLAQYCADFVQDSGRRLLAILGDFGTGKTTFVRRLLKQRTSPICDEVPLGQTLLAELKGYASGSGLRDHLSGEFRRRCQLSFDSSLLDEFLDQPSSLLLLDGLDEMAQTNLAADPRRGFRESIEAIIHQTGRCHLIVTSRNEYIRDSHIESGLTALGFDVVYIAHWTEDDVQRYLSRCQDAGLLDDSEAIWGEISDRFDLPDILRRPIFASLFVKGSNRLLGEGHIRTVSIYKDHIDEWLTYQAFLRAGILHFSDMKFFVESLALHMAVQAKTALAVEEFDETVGVAFAKRLGPASYMEKLSAATQALSQDSRTNTLLSRRGDYYSFGHKSFLEYFVAERLVREILDGCPDYLSRLTVSDDILYFVWQLYAEQCRSEGPLNEILLESSDENVLSWCLEVRRMLCAFEGQLRQEFDARFIDEGDALAVNVSEMTQFRYVCGGDSILGSCEEDGEKPVRRVRISEFEIMTYTVTSAEYLGFLNEVGYVPRSGKTKRYYEILSRKHPDHPAVFVCLADALAYAEWKNARLPTEEEWERACRGRLGRRWPWGDVLLEDLLNSASRDIRDTCSVREAWQNSSPFGVRGMAGNVWEWTSTQVGPYHVVRGGSWSDKPEKCRCSSRETEDPRNSYNSLGFRLARDVH